MEQEWREPGTNVSNGRRWRNYLLTYILSHYSDDVGQRRIISMPPPPPQTGCAAAEITCRAWIPRVGARADRTYPDRRWKERESLHLSSYGLIPWKEKCDRVTCARRPLRSIHATTAAVPSINTGLVFAVRSSGPIQSCLSFRTRNNENNHRVVGRDGETKSMKISNFERWIYWVADNGNPIKILSRIYRIFVHAIYIKVCFHAKLIASAKYNCTRFSSTMFRVSMFRECVIDSRINYIRGTELMCHSACNGVSIQ